MPNWCDNTITLTHSDPAMIQRAHDALERSEFLNEFHPVPSELKIVAGRVGEDTDPEQIDLVAKEEANKAKFCLLYTSPSPRDRQKSRMPSSA